MDLLPGAFGLIGKWQLVIVVSKFRHVLHFSPQPLHFLHPRPIPMYAKDLGRISVMTAEKNVNIVEGQVRRIHDAHVAISVIIVIGNVRRPITSITRSML